MANRPQFVLGRLQQFLKLDRLENLCSGLPPPLL